MECKSILFVSLVLLMTVQMTLSKEENQTKRHEDNPGSLPDNAVIKPTECSPLEIPAFGRMVCGGWAELKHCTAGCLPGYTFEGKEAKKIVLECNKGKWTPANKFPRCIRETGQGRNFKKVHVGELTDDFYDFDDFLNHYPGYSYEYYYVI